MLFDADFLAFQAAANVTRVVEWDDGILTTWADLEAAKEAFCNQVEALRSRSRRWSTAKVIMCFTDDYNWRKDVLPSYKAARSGVGKGKPIAYWLLVEWIKENFECFQRPGLEGDDCMGILSTKPSLIDCTHTIIVSPDKDFKTIPGEFFWMTTGESLVLTEEDANYWHMYQTLMGDTTDGYAGCPGIGPGSAAEFLAEPHIVYEDEKVLKSGPRKGETVKFWTKRPLEHGEDLWDGIVSLFVKAGLTEEDALVQARVARILRASDFDFKEKRPILWTRPAKEDVGTD
ncbi:exonuclease [Ralstonia phage RSB2]|uniref:Exonuclease-like protein n=1 Tax=Ralstonia phage RSB2 TaxID=913183 RepID=E5RV13_9CAUD|nr:exonuclease [Ralstonia phage RSB2]BAJ51821.1 exonuclease-like protein [Ralstonia phage RSB2]